MVPRNENKSEEHIPTSQQLRHIAFIMDGNGRWAENRGMPRKEGHLAGAQTFYRIAAYCHSIGIECVTVYAFSTENWKRPPEEVHAIMNIIEGYVDRCIENIQSENVHIRFIGNLSVFSKEFREKIEMIDKETSHNSFSLNIAINYGGREEIVQACQALVRKGKNNLTEADIASHLYTAGCPDPDLIVRTGGDIRISNFMLWQSAYAEYYFSDVLWPDFSQKDVDAAVAAFYLRCRRFGGV